MAKIELKPCPFCGKAGLLVMANSGTSLHPTRILNSYYIRCAGCNVRTPSYDSDIRQEDNGTITIKADGAEMAAEAWNKRFEDTTLEYKRLSHPDKEAMKKTEEFLKPYRCSCQSNIMTEAHTELDPVILNKV